MKVEMEPRASEDLASAPADVQATFEKVKAALQAAAAKAGTGEGSVDRFLAALEEHGLKAELVEPGDVTPQVIARLQNPVKSH